MSRRRDIDGNLKRYCSFNSLRRNERFYYTQMESVFEIFEKVKIGIGQLTRKKIEQITSKFLGEQQNVKAIGEKLIECIQIRLIQEKEIQELMKSKHEKVAWDYILIDE